MGAVKNLVDSIQEWTTETVDAFLGSTTSEAEALAARVSAAESKIREMMAERQAKYKLLLIDPPTQEDREAGAWVVVNREADAELARSARANSDAVAGRIHQPFGPGTEELTSPRLPEALSGFLTFGALAAMDRKAAVAGILAIMGDAESKTGLPLADRVTRLKTIASDIARLEGQLAKLKGQSTAAEKTAQLLAQRRAEIDAKNTAMDKATYGPFGGPHK